MNWKQKKGLLLTGLFVAIFAVGYANYALKKGPETTTQPETAEQDSFAVFKEERQTTREQELRYIESVMESAEADEAAKTQAQTQKLALAANMENELLTEGLIRTGLGMESVVTVSAGAVNVVVDTATLSETEVTQIADIVKTHLQTRPQDIKIMARS